MPRPLLVPALLVLWITSLSVAASAADRLGLFVIDIETGKVTPAATEPLPEYTYCGSPGWSADGKSLLLDATPGRAWTKSHILATDFPVS